jgi:hypothetical protein
LIPKLFPKNILIFSGAPTVLILQMNQSQREILEVIWMIGVQREKLVCLATENLIPTVDLIVYFERFR